MEQEEISSLDPNYVRDECRNEFLNSENKAEVYATSKLNLIRSLVFQRDRDWHFLDALGNTSEWTILDYGPGVGYWSTYLKWTKLMIVEAYGLPTEYHQSVYEGNDKVEVFPSEAFVLNPPEELFDLVIFADVIEHLTNPMEVLTKLTSSMVPGGLMIFYFAMSFHDGGHLKETIDNAPECQRYILNHFDLVRKLDRGRYYLLAKKEKPACQEY